MLITIIILNTPINLKLTRSISQARAQKILVTVQYVVTVSYTHLDVYKRQAPDHGRDRCHQ